MVIRWLASLQVLHLACSFTPGVGLQDGGRDAVAPPDTGATSDDAGVDASVLVCPWPYSPLFVDPCGGGGPLASSLELSAGAYTYDTDSGVLIDPGATATMPPSTTVMGMRVVWTTRFTVGGAATLRATGGLPLVIISESTIDIAGTIDVSSVWVDRTTFTRGAGASPSVCPADPPGAGQVCAQHGGSGGGGGGFGGAGGDGGEGGDGRSCGTDGKPGGAGGPALAGFPSTLRGGCAGRDGAQNDSGTTDRGRGGHGGGAIQLVARGTLDVSGVIHAGGAGGTHGNANRSGGGGGGAGGMIVLDGTTVTIASTAILAANGGGGGGGSDNAPATSGTNGRPDDAVAEGGPKQGTGSDGANGGFSTTSAQSAGIAERGGGGGGGGIGFIKLRSASVASGATLSPPPTP